MAVMHNSAGAGASGPGLLDRAGLDSRIGGVDSTSMALPPPRRSWSGWLRVEALAAQVLVAFAVFLAGFVVFVFFLSTLPAGRAQTGLERRFEKPLANGKAPVGGVIPYGTPVARLDIPRIGLHQIVVEGTAAAQLAEGPGHLAVSPLPGQIGNAVIAGHRIIFGGPFGRLGGLALGTPISVVTGQGHFTYQVTDRRVVGAADTAPFQATTANRLTLVTADGSSGSRRLVVIAALRGPAKPFPPGRPSVLRATDGGLVGQSGHLGGLAGWALLLVALAGASVAVYRRLPRWSGYLATTPVIVLAAWIVYVHLALILPSTL
jgi:sortase A